MAGFSRQRTGIPGRDALDHHAARAALAVEVRLPAPSLRANGSARMRGEVVKTCLELHVIASLLHVIASAAKQSILSLRQDGLLRFARNDGRGNGLLCGACHRARTHATRWLAMT